MPAPNKIDRAEVTRRLLSGEGTASIARALGVNDSSVSYWRTKVLGLPRTFAPRKFDHARVRELHARGYSDEDISADVGIARPRIGRIRRAMGLPAHGRKSVHFAAKQRACGLRRTAALFAATGYRSLRSLDGARYRAKSRDLARRYGLPDDLPRVAVAVVVALVRGPMPALRLAAAVGRRGTHPNAYHRFDYGASRSFGAKNYLTLLVRLGLVARLARHPRPSVYALTPACLDRLAAAGKGVRDGR